jgi:hypothetical protein
MRCWALQEPGALSVGEVDVSEGAFSIELLLKPLTLAGVFSSLNGLSFSEAGLFSDLQGKQGVRFLQPEHSAHGLRSCGVLLLMWQTSLPQLSGLLVVGLHTWFAVVSALSHWRALLFLVF